MVEAMSGVLDRARVEGRTKRDAKEASRSGVSLFAD
jgi:hypothetical protein